MRLRSSGASVKKGMVCGSIVSSSDVEDSGHVDRALSLVLRREPVVVETRPKLWSLEDTLVSVILAIYLTLSS